MSRELVKYSISSNLGASFRCGLNVIVLEQGITMFKAEDVARVFKMIDALVLQLGHNSGCGIYNNLLDGGATDCTCQRGKAQRLLAGLENKGGPI